ncbi:MAG: hypothetical protein JWN63_2583, partial [Candidatus Acidoferrum typicum]|nr:hypothetical protein [Candidatus Acidoferrum typicum]
ELLTGQMECPLELLQKCVLEAVENFARGAHQADDLTLLIVRYRAAAAAATSDTDAPLSAASPYSASAAASSASSQDASPSSAPAQHSGPASAGSGYVQS